MQFFSSVPEIVFSGVKMSLIEHCHQTLHTTIVNNSQQMCTDIEVSTSALIS
jgi:hypothetical protein